MKQDQIPTPVFCPTCGMTGAESDARTCPHCGDRFQPQGYCAVCEDFIARPPGWTCPKHDLELESRARPRLSLEEYEGPWVEVARFPDALDCQPVRIRLEGEGIPTIIDGSRMGSRSMYQVATGGVRLEVPEGLAADARVILSQTWSQDAEALGIEDDWDDLDDDGLGAGASEENTFLRLAYYLVAAGFVMLGGGIAFLFLVHLGRISGW